MTLDFTHLSAAARLQVFESGDARVRLVSSAGITARATRLITRAAAEAIADGTECIDCVRIDAMNARKLSDAA